MILARITKAIREQNWFAVAIEFVIVIAGVVIGFQVTDWRATIEARAEEAALLERLHSDLENVSSDRWDWAADRAGNRDLLISASAILFGDREGELTAAQCNALAQSHVFNSPSLDIPILTELLSTGELDLIRPLPVREAITQHFLSNGWSAEIDTAINHVIYNLSARHPQYFRFNYPDDPQDWNPLFDGSARCDGAGMRSDPRFLNELADNISKSVYFMRAVLEGPNESFRSLHAAVDAELGIEHEAAP
ncbi:hypothetical protein [Maricaulis maris]|jgi:hypothetical protein|uniref:Uncharacterized protein n=1 Tax=Maricaulis maris (strain MCS10) TaxID=394221 RepID=Q0ASW8_MARMM|nr:hypothetical protein [Maricaulis maris]ABI64619.1 hypothetical protein Mmar10_0326 [Maricaulis maris MCS10]